MKSEIVSPEVGAVITGLLGMIMLILSLIVFVDFLGQGFLKRKKWTTLLYFPIYRLFSVITLSFLYRPLAYNFLDNRFGKRLSLLLLPFYIAIVFLSNLDYERSNYLSTESLSSKYYGSSQNYNVEITEKTDFIKTASIPSKIIRTNFLDLFVLFEEDIEDQILENSFDSELVQDIRGYHSDFVREVKQGWEIGEKGQQAITAQEDSIYGIYTTAFSEIYTVRIDTDTINSDYIISTNAKKRLGFETYIDIEKLAKGKHVLSINGPTKADDREGGEITDGLLVSIPFWYYPQSQSTAGK